MIMKGQLPLQASLLNMSEFLGANFFVLNISIGLLGKWQDPLWLEIRVLNRVYKTYMILISPTGFVELC